MRNKYFILVALFLSVVLFLKVKSASVSQKSDTSTSHVQEELTATKKALQEAEKKLNIYEAPYENLLVLKDKKPRPKGACDRCCCGQKSMSACHIACMRYQGEHSKIRNDSMCSGFCMMKARGIPMPLEHGTVPESANR